MRAVLPGLRLQVMAHCSCSKDSLHHLEATFLFQTILHAYVSHHKSRCLDAHHLLILPKRNRSRRTWWNSLFLDEKTKLRRSSPLCYYIPALLTERHCLKCSIEGAGVDYPAFLADLFLASGMLKCQ